MMQIVNYHGHSKPEPTVRLERLEDEMNRYGSVTPTQSGSYVINPVCRLRQQTLPDRSVSSLKSDCANYMCAKKKRNNFELISEVSVAKNCNVKDSGFVRTTSPLWPPVYEDISDSETESPSINEIKESSQKICKFMFSENIENMKIVSLNTGKYASMDLHINPEHYVSEIISQPKAILTGDTVPCKTGDKRRNSAPAQVSGQKRRQKSKKRERRWSFDSKPDKAASGEVKRRRRSYLNRVMIQHRRGEDYKLFIRVSSSEESFDDDDDEDYLNYNVQIKTEPTSSEDDIPNKSTKTKDSIGIEDEDTIEAPNPSHTTEEKTLSTSAEVDLNFLSNETVTGTNDASNSELCKNEPHVSQSRRSGVTNRKISKDTPRNEEYAYKFVSQEVSDNMNNECIQNISSRKENFGERNSMQEGSGVLKRVASAPSNKNIQTDVKLAMENKSKRNDISNVGNALSCSNTNKEDNSLKRNKHDDTSDAKRCDEIELMIDQPVVDVKDKVTNAQNSKLEDDAIGKIHNDLSVSENKIKKQELISKVNFQTKTNEVKTATDIKKELSKIRELRKQNTTKYPRFSRERFRHDKIEMFKISSDLSSAPHRNLKKKLNTEMKGSALTLPVFSPDDDTTSGMDIEDDTPSPASLTIDLDEPEVNVKANSAVEQNEENVSQIDKVVVFNEEESSNNKKASIEDAVKLIECKKLTNEIDDQIVNEKQDSESKEKEGETSDEGQSKKKRKRIRKSNSGDPSVMEEVRNQIFSNLMQEKGRRLAQELPGFNWLEEKILSGGVSKMVSPKRPITQDASEPIISPSLPEGSKSSIVCQSKVQAARPTAKKPISTSCDLPDSPGNAEHRDGTGPPPKRHRLSCTEAVPGSEELSKTASFPSSEKPVSPVEQLRTTPEQLPIPDKEEYLQKQQASRKPVIVSPSELGQSPNVGPLLKQLASAGELEVTLSMPHSSSSLSDSIAESSVTKVPISGGHSESAYVRLEPVNSSHKPQENCDYRQELAGDTSNSQPRRVSYGIESLQQPFQYHRHGNHWQNEGSVRKHPEVSQAERSYSDRIATMARHAAMSFDTGLVGPAAVLEAAHRAQRRTFPRPPHQSQQTSDLHAPHVPGYDTRFQFPRSLPSFVPPHPVRPQVIRPSAQYPPNAHYRPPPYIQYQPVTNRPCLISRVPQENFLRHQGMMQIPHKDKPPRPVLSNNNVQPRSSVNEIPPQISPTAAEPGTAHPNKAVQDLELLEKIKKAKQEELHMLELRKEKTIRDIQRAEQQIERTAAVAGQVTHPRPPVPTGTTENVMTLPLNSVAQRINKQDVVQMPIRSSYLQDTTILNAENQPRGSNSYIESSIDVQRHEPVNMLHGETTSAQHKPSVSQRTAVPHHRTHSLSDHPRQGFIQMPNLIPATSNPLQIPCTAADQNTYVSSGIRNIMPSLQAAPTVTTSSTRHEPHYAMRPLPHLPLNTVESFSSQVPSYHTLPKQRTQNCPQLSPIHKASPSQPELIQVDQVSPSQTQGTTLKSHLLKSLQGPPRPVPLSTRYQHPISQHGISTSVPQYQYPATSQPQYITPAEQSKNVVGSSNLVVDKSVSQFNPFPPPPPLKPAPHKGQELVHQNQAFTKCTSQIMSRPHENAFKATKLAPHNTNEDHPIDLSFNKQKTSNSAASPQGSSNSAENRTRHSETIMQHDNVPQEHSRLHKPTVPSLSRMCPHPGNDENRGVAHHSDRHDQTNSSVQNNGISHSPHLDHSTQHTKMYTDYQQPQRSLQVPGLLVHSSSNDNRNIFVLHLQQHQTVQVAQNSCPISHKNNPSENLEPRGSDSTRNKSKVSCEVATVVDSRIISSNEAPDGTSVPAENGNCTCCAQPAQFKCSACHQALYCSKKCQTRHWITHAVECEALQQRE